MKLNIWDYLEERAFYILGNLFFMILLGIYLKMTGSPFASYFYVLLAWGLILAASLILRYCKDSARYRKILSCYRELPEKYLICEVIKGGLRPESQMEQLYFDLAKGANKAMIETIEEAERTNLDYQEYIEEWIHEIKTPISAAGLLLANHKSPQNEALKKEIRRIDGLVEQALYYARSGCVQQDYFIKECVLSEAVQAALVHYRTEILGAGIRLEVGELQETVYTDEKWLCFLIGQILSNAVKYQDKENPVIRIKSGQEREGAILMIEDNGAGIAPEDLPRIYEKGFTGGDRKKKRATGIGLYLCRKLCERLGLTISVQSEQGRGTTVTIGFPVGTMHRFREDAPD